MFDIDFFFDVDYEVTRNKAVELCNKGAEVGGLSFSELVQLVFYDGAARFAAIILSTHGSY